MQTISLEVLALPSSWTRKRRRQDVHEHSEHRREDEVDGKEAQLHGGDERAADDPDVGRASPPDDEVAQREEERLEDYQEVRRRRRDEAIYRRGSIPRRGRRGRSSSCWRPNGDAALRPDLSVNERSLGWLLASLFGAGPGQGPSLLRNSCTTVNNVGVSIRESAYAGPEEQARAERDTRRGRAALRREGLLQRLDTGTSARRPRRAPR